MALRILDYFFGRPWNLTSKYFDCVRIFTSWLLAVVVVAVKAAKVISVSWLNISELAPKSFQPIFFKYQVGFCLPKLMLQLKCALIFRNIIFL